MNKVYIGNLPYETTSKDLITLMSQFGEILEAMVIPDKFREGKSKGFGFVTFATPEEAQKALSMQGQEYNGRTLIVDIAKTDNAGNPA